MMISWYLRYWAIAWLLLVSACKPNHLQITSTIPPQVSKVSPTPTIEPSSLVQKALTYIDPWTIRRSYQLTMTHRTDGGTTTTITEYDEHGNYHERSTNGSERYLVNHQAYWKYEGKWRRDTSPNDAEFVFQMGLTLIQGNQPVDAISKAIASTGFTVTTPTNAKLVTYSHIAGLEISEVSYEARSSQGKIADVKIWIRMADSLPIRLEASGHLPEFGFFNHFKITREFNFDTPIMITAPITRTTQ